jgi:hypothetical protein
MACRTARSTRMQLQADMQDRGLVESQRWPWHQGMTAGQDVLHNACKCLGILQPPPIQALVGVATGKLHGHAAS